MAQEKEPNPIGFTLPDGAKGRAWVASDNDGSKIIGDDRLWRVNIQRNFFVRGSDAPKQSPGCQRPTRYAGPSLSLVAMTQCETLMMRFRL